MVTRSGLIREIAADISQSQLWLSALPRYHSLRPVYASLLGLRLLDRFVLSNQKDDINKAILYFTESLLFPPISWPAHGLMILKVLSYLALSLFERSRVFKKSEDVICVAKYLRYLRGPAYTPLAIDRKVVSALLVETLEMQMLLKASDGVQTLQEMTAITHELLTSDPPSDHTTSASACFARAVGRKLHELSPDRLLNDIMECLRLARVHKPELREVPFFLAKCLFTRYIYTLGNELDEIVSIVDEMIASSSPGDVFLAECQEFVPTLAMIRLMDRRPETSEEAIYRACSFLASSSVEDPLYLVWSQVLENAAKKRFENFGPIDGLGVPPWPVPADITQQKRPLSKLLEGIRNNNVTNIDEAVKLGRYILASYDPSDLQSSHKFCQILCEAFKRTKNTNYLNELSKLINTRRQLLARRPPKLPRIQTTFWHWRSLIARFEVSPGHRTQDLQEVVELIPQFLDDGGQLLSLPHRFNATCIWALFAQAAQHPSASAAYETAFSLMQDITLVSPTLQLKHATPAALPVHSHRIPLGYASHQVEGGQLEQAIETLERGRALLWSEMRHLRTPIDQLLNADPQLGHKFAAINRDLEELTKSISPSHTLRFDDGPFGDLKAADPFGRLLLKQRGLLKGRDKLISQIRTLPGFDRFLTFPPFDTLRSAASSGPVIIVNHSKLRSDILILLYNASPSLIPTPDDFYRRANTLHDKLSDSRVKDGLDSTKYDKTLASVLTGLYELVGEPVVFRLRQLQVPEQSRVWWCPTSVFCSLPLHAMGPIPSDDGELRYFLDLYICSYTPSLSALIQSRNRNSGSRSSDRPSVLLVAQLDPTLPTVGGTIQVVQALDTEVTSLISEAATPAAVLNGFHHHQFVHFACHGILKANKPFEAGFELGRDERLTLLEIVRADLPNAEFAFLSVCHSAELTDGSIMDEVLHLAAAMQYSGFRSVVGAMWAMVDEDGRDLAENFYKALFSNSRREQGTPYHERSAKALRFAVKKLRRKRRMTLERWVNFVHYGA